MKRIYKIAIEQYFYPIQKLNKELNMMNSKCHKLLFDKHMGGINNHIIC